jgi:hypothetical protein
MNPPPIPSRQGLTSLPRRAPSAASTTPPTTSTSTSKLPSIPDFLPPATNPSTSYPGSTLDLSRESSVPFPRPSPWIPRARVPLGARPLPPSISPSVPLRSIHTDDPTQSPSSLLSSDFQGSQSQSQSHHAQAQPHPPRPASSMSLSCREMHTQTPYAAQPQPQLIPIESYRPLPPDSARSSRAPTPQLGAFSRLGLEGIGGVAARRERAGSVDSGPLRSAAELFLASSMPKQTASEKVLAAISGGCGASSPSFHGPRRIELPDLASCSMKARRWLALSVGADVFRMGPSRLRPACPGHAREQIPARSATRASNGTTRPGDQARSDRGDHCAT